jgi:hypothetical protein
MFGIVITEKDGFVSLAEARYQTLPKRSLTITSHLLKENARSSLKLQFQNSIVPKIEQATKPMHGYRENCSRSKKQKKEGFAGDVATGDRVRIPPLALVETKIFEFWVNGLLVNWVNELSFSGYI